MLIHQFHSSDLTSQFTEFILLRYLMIILFLKNHNNPVSSLHVYTEFQQCLKQRKIGGIYPDPTGG